MPDLLAVNMSWIGCRFLGLIGSSWLKLYPRQVDGETTDGSGCFFEVTYASKRLVAAAESRGWESLTLELSSERALTPDGYLSPERLRSP
jgi:hypothetical protein